MNVRPNDSSPDDAHVGQGPSPRDADRVADSNQTTAPNQSTDPDQTTDHEREIASGQDDETILPVSHESAHGAQDGSDPYETVIQSDASSKTPGHRSGSGSDPSGSHRSGGGEGDSGKRVIIVRGYEVMEELGRGGMGVVYAARQVSLNRVVALKMVLTGVHASATARARFMREAEYVARLKHPNVVQVLDLGEQDGQPYYAMEYVDGGDLRSVIDRAPLAPREAAELLEQLADAVGCAHRQGIVHRDLKPANVLLTREGLPKITDFGLAKNLEAGSTLSSTGDVLGTPAYMSPEQARGQIGLIGPATDVHALGAMLYELLTGQRPFDGNSNVEVIRRIATSDPASLLALRSGIPRDLVTICSACLRKEPQERYVDGSALATDLRRFLDGEPPLITPTPRHKQIYRWIRKRPVLMLSSVLTVLLLLLAIAFGWKEYADHRHFVDYENEVIEYYRYVTWKYDVADGVGKIDQETSQDRYFSIRITRQGRLGPVVRAEMIDSQGELHPDMYFFSSVETSKMTGGMVPEHERTTRIDYEYDANGQVKGMQAHNRTGRPVWAFRFSTPTEGQYLRVTSGSGTRSTSQSTAKRLNDGDLRRPVALLDIASEAAHVSAFPDDRSGTGATHIVFEWDAQGFCTKQRFFDPFGNPKPSTEETGEYGVRSEFNDRGLEFRRTFLGPDGNDRPRRDGVLSVEITANKDGLPVEERFLDEQGNLTNGNEGYAVARTSYNSNGNAIAGEFLDPDLQPIRQTNGYQAWAAVFDKGRQLQSTYTGYDVDTFGYSKMRVIYGSDQRPAESSFLNDDDEYVLCPDGYAGWTDRYDEQGNLVEQRFFGLDRQPVLSSNRTAGWRATYDQRGNQITYEYLGLDGQLTLSDEDIAGWRSTFDDRDNEIQHEFFGVDGRPRRLTTGSLGWKALYDGRRLLNQKSYGFDGSEGYVAQNDIYDEHGNAARVILLDENDRPVRAKDGTAGWKNTYDEKGNWLEMIFVGVNGEPTRHINGYAITRSTFDDSGNEVRRAYLDENGQLSANAGDGGIAGWTSEFDDDGNEVLRQFFDVNGQPTRYRDGEFGWRAEYEGTVMRRQTWFGHVGAVEIPNITATYDRRGNTLDSRNTDADGNLILDENGVAGWKNRLDQQNQLIERLFFGTDEQLTLNNEEIAGWRSEFDDAGHEVKREFLGLDLLPTRHRDGNTGWIEEFADGRLVSRLYYGYPSDNYFQSKRQIYNERELVTAVYFLNDDGKLTLNDEMVAGWKNTFDERGNWTDQAYFGLEEQLRNNIHGFAINRSVYDEDDHEIERWFLDSDGNRTANKADGGIAGWRSQFDADGNIIRRDFLDADGNPAHYANGATGWSERFQDGRRIERVDFGYINAEQGYAKWIRRYDEHDQITETYVTNEQDQLVGIPPAGVAKWRFQYDDAGHNIRYETSGPDDQPIRGEEGYQQWTASFDGDMLSERHYTGFDGSLGFVATREKFGDNGVVVETQYLDADDQLTLHKHGYAGWHDQFNDDGDWTNRTYYDRRQQPVKIQIVVDFVDPKSQADQVGIQVGDILVSYDGKPIQDSSTLRMSTTAVLSVDEENEANDKASETIALVLIHEGEQLSFRVRRGLLGVITHDQAIKGEEKREEESETGEAAD
ncbi:MAG: protein kinase [Planctomycetales bacterium]|nr:protein kinase [Planctomycetales bacterium]